MEEEIYVGMQFINAINSGRKLQSVMPILRRKYLFKANGTLHVLLLCAPKKTNVFVPFLYMLGEKISPSGVILKTADLKENYSIVAGIHATLCLITLVSLFATSKYLNKSHQCWLIPHCFYQLTFKSIDTIWYW